MVKVFLSSPFSELQAYRRAVIEDLQSKDYDVICMEKFGANEHVPTRVCSRYVSRCDVFVILLARSYGFIPPGCSKSMTHLEYDAATENCKPRLVFLLDDRAAWPVAEEDGERTRQLRDFSKLLQQAHTCDFFGPDIDDVLNKVGKALERWRERDQLQKWLHEIYRGTAFQVESDLQGVVRASAERICREVDALSAAGGPVPIGIAGGPLIRKIVNRIGEGRHDWPHSEWIGLNRAGECNHYFYSANYQCTRLAEISGGTSYVSLEKQTELYEAIVSRLRLMICSCGGTDGFLSRRLRACCGHLPTGVIGDFCLTPIDERGKVVDFGSTGAGRFLKGLDSRPRFKALHDLTNADCRILLPLAKTNDQGVEPVAVRNRADAVKAVLSSGIVTHCILSEDMTTHLLLPRVRGYQFLRERSRDELGCVYDAIRCDTGDKCRVRVIDSGVGAGGSGRPDAVDKEIIISDAPEAARPGQVTAISYFVRGSIERAVLYDGVRKPGNWAATAIRLAEEQLSHFGENERAVRVLDLGCGSGVIGSFIARDARVQKVVFADINEAAIACAMENAKQNGVADKCTAAEAGDLFLTLEPNNREFEIIIFGAPFFPRLDGVSPDKLTDADLATGAAGNEIALRFVEKVSGHLSHGGRAITYLADYIPHDVLTDKAKLEGLIPQEHRVTILYPNEPRHRFSPSFEIQWRRQLERWFRTNGQPNPFTDETWEDRTFLGFDMVYFILIKK